MMSTTHSGFAIAATVAALFAAGATLAPATVSAADMPTVKCAGINSCKGTSECASATNQCKGQNECKGHGWISKKSAAECEAAGGSVVMDKK
jgi:hypothetical protein